jgi:hypothetical protein
MAEYASWSSGYPLIKTVRIVQRSGTIAPIQLMAGFTDAIVITSSKVSAVVHPIAFSCIIDRDQRRYGIPPVTFVISI